MAPRAGKKYSAGRADMSQGRKVRKRADEKYQNQVSAEEAVVKLAVAFWRFARIFERAVSKLGEGEAARYRNAAADFVKKTEDALVLAGMRTVSIEGMAFDPGMAATPLNIEDFGPFEKLEVDAMIEPIIMGRDGLVRMGSVTLRKMKI